jgi:hypothetical protein
VFLATPPDANTKNDRACPVSLMQADVFGGLHIHPAKMTFDSVLAHAPVARGSRACAPLRFQLKSIAVK